MDRVPNDEESVRRLIGRLGDRRLLAVCYEAGPSGYELHRLITSMGGGVRGDRAVAGPEGRVSSDGSRPTAATRSG